MFTKSKQYFCLFLSWTFENHYERVKRASAKINKFIQWTKKLIEHLNSSNKSISNAILKSLYYCENRKKKKQHMDFKDQWSNKTIAIIVIGVFSSEHVNIYICFFSTELWYMICSWIYDVFTCKIINTIQLFNKRSES